MNELGVDVWISHRQPDGQHRLVGGTGEEYVAIPLSTKAKECFGFLNSNLKKEMGLKDDYCLPGADDSEQYETNVEMFCQKVVEFCKKHNLTYKVG